MADIYHLVFIKSASEKIYEAITTQKGIASWWSVHNNAKPEVGSIYRISFGGDYHKDIEITELAANKRVSWKVIDAHPEWLNTTVTFEIGAGPEAGELRFTHGGWKEQTDMFGQCNHHWGVYLQNLKILPKRVKRLVWQRFFKRFFVRLSELKNPIRHSTKQYFKN